MKHAVRFILALVLLACGAGSASGQRMSENLGRGMLVLHSSTSQAYLSWRLLAHEPADVGFYVYRSANGAAAVRLNATPITNTTDFLDTTATFTVSNHWYVTAVTNGVEGTPSPVAALPANSPVRQYLSLPLQPVIGGNNPPYDALSCFPADLDADGEYDYVVTRTAAGSSNLPPYQFLQVYRRDGTLLWQLNAGPNSANQYSYGPGSTALTFGDSQHVTVFDMDGDGKAEVLVKSGNGMSTIRTNGTTITNIVAPSDVTEYVSVFDGLTGAERSRINVPNPAPADGVLFGRFGIVYADGVRPSLIYPSVNRSDATSTVWHSAAMLFDFRDGQLSQRWYTTTNLTSRGHQIRIADVTHDGIDDLCEIAAAYDSSTGLRICETGIVHGDRYHVTDIDPNRPGLEVFAIQQNNYTLLATLLYEAATAHPIRQWYSSTVADVGRGDTVDMDPRRAGMESFSTQPGLYDATGEIIPGASPPFPTLGIYWDGDLRREFMSGAGSTLEAPTIDKWTLTEASPNGVNVRLYSIYNEGVHQGNGGRPSTIADLLGDWREEVVLPADDYSELRIYCTKLPASNRVYCLMQNPAYRVQSICRGYTQSPNVDYFLGEGMDPPAPPPSVNAQLRWRGSTANTWDSSSANWVTNAVWIGTNPPVAFATGRTVLFDLTGSNHAAVALAGTLQPGRVTVHSPKDYTFGGTGSLAGAMSLVKAGGGRLVLLNSNSFTGPTTIWEGALVVHGRLSGSPVTVRGGVFLDGALCGTGVVSHGATLHRGASLSPGAATNSPGTLTISNGLTLAGGAFVRIDLSDAASGPGITNDLVQIQGDLTLTGTNTIAIQQLDATLQSGGIYPLIQYSGALNGTLSNLVVTGTPGIPCSLTNGPGLISLVVRATRAPAAVTWTGGTNSNRWDLLGATNWLLGATNTAFAPSDAVSFTSAGAANSSVELSGNLNPSSILVDAANDYTLAGPGVISGATGLIKTNSGTLTISNLAHTFTGRTLIAGGTLVVPRLDSVGHPSPLGNPGAHPSNLVLLGGATLRVTSDSHTDRGVTLGSGTGTIHVATSSEQVTIGNQITGAGTLRLLGPGTLALIVSNNYTGGTRIENGSLSLGTTGGNVNGLGTGLVTLDGGTLRMIEMGSGRTSAWPLHVDAGRTGRVDVDSSCTLAGALTGGGTLTVGIPATRANFSGNWSAFSGTIKPVAVSGLATFRCGHAAGFPLARVNLGSSVELQNRLGSTPTLPIGELSGTSASAITATGGSDGLPVRWLVGALNSSATFSGRTSNNVGFVKVGTGTWTLNGTLAHTGPTTISNGTLLVDGNARPANGAITVASGGTLGGIGVLGGVVTIQNGGALAPGGTNTGVLSISNQLTLNPGALARFALGTANDLVQVSSNLTLGGSLHVSSSGGFTNGTYTLFTYGGAFASSGFTVASAPTNFTCSINTATPGQVRLVVTYGGTLPGAPATLNATPADSQVTLNWSAVSNATSYYVKRALTSAGPFTPIAIEISGTTFTDTHATNGVAYHYVVTAFNGAGQGPASPSDFAMPPGIPAAPTGLIAMPGDRDVSLEWNPSDWATGYNVRRSTTNGGPYVTIASNIAASAFLSSGLSNGVPYYFVVSALNTNGESANSTPASATPTPPVLAFWTNLATSAPQNWNVNGNWTNVSAFPNSNGIVAVVTANIAASQTNQLNQPITVGGLTLGDANGSASYTLASNGGSLTFDNGLNPAALTQAATSRGDTISAPVFLVSHLRATNASTNTLAFRGPLASTNASLTLAGGKYSFLTNGTLSGPVTLAGSTSLFLTVSANNGAFGTGTVTFQDATLQLYGSGLGDSASGYGTFDNRLVIPAGRSGTLLTGPRYTLGSTLTGGGTLNLKVDYVRGDISGNWSGFTGLINVARSGNGPDEFRVQNPSGFPGAHVSLATNVLLASIAASGSTIPIGALTAEPGALIGGSGNVVTWRVGDLNTDTTNAARIAGTAALLKVGTGIWTLTGDNTQSGLTTVSNGTLRLLNPLASPTGAGAVDVLDGATLSGHAQVDGPAVIRSGGRLAPGTGSSILTFNSGLTLQSGAETVLKVSKSPRTNDALVVVGSLACDGQLTVEQTDTNAFEAGDTLALVNASAFAGNFQTVDLPPLPAGLTWDTSDLASNGTITATSTLPPGASHFQTTLSFPSYNSNETLTNIALLVVLGPGVPDFDYSQFVSDSGDDLRFTAPGFSGYLAHEVDTWNPAGDSRVWVRFPRFSNGTTLVASWGNALASDPLPSTTNGTTWSGGYAGVWHLTDSNALDSTASRHDASPANTTTIPGLVGNAHDFDGLSQSVVVPASPDFDLATGFEVHGWFKIAPADKPGPSQFRTLTAKEAPASFTNRNWWIALRDDGFLWWKSSDNIDITNAVDLADDAWHQFAAVHNGSNATLYIDGRRAAVDPTPGVVDIQTAPVLFGNESGTTRYHKGALDEMRISSVPRSSNWVWTVYRNIASNDTFAVASPVIAVATSNTPPALSPVADRQIGPGSTLAFTNFANDADLPPQALAFSLLDPPPGASVGPSNGVFTWRPAVSLAGSSTPMTLVVMDDGTPPLGATQQFLVTVLPISNAPFASEFTWTNGNFRMRITGIQGPDYVIQTSSNLVNWTNLFVTNSPSLPFHWTDTNASTVPGRFYRIRLTP